MTLADDIKQDALDRYPQEACGVIVDGEYWPQPNIADDPEKDFEIDPSIWVQTNGRIEGVVHSHPDPDAWKVKPNGRFVRPPGFWPFCPSANDMRGQSNTAVTWWIVVTDGEQVSEPFWWDDSLLDWPLEQRDFRHGVFDCYHIIQSFHWQTFGRLLPDFPREPAWWKQGYDLYRENFGVAGFRELRRNEEPEKGDVFLARVGLPRPDVLNHGGVYTGQGLILHHLMGRRSAHEPMAPYINAGFHEIWLRYDPCTATSSSTAP